MVGLCHLCSAAGSALPIARSGSSRAYDRVRADEFGNQYRWDVFPQFARVRSRARVLQFARACKLKPVMP